MIRVVPPPGSGRPYNAALAPNGDRRKPCALELTPRQLALLLKYGLPFDEEAEPLRSSKVRDGVHVAHVDPYWISMWTADIVRSARKIHSQSLREELDALCDVLENAESHDRRVRGLSVG